MPEYVTPGVYVEETSFRAKSIEGVSTSTTGFVGPTRKGPVGGTPELITSVGDFERIYGSLDDLSFGRNYLAHGVRGYFAEGGARLYVSRAYVPSGPGDGRAVSQDVVTGGDDSERVRFRARFPGAAGNGSIRVEQLASEATVATMARALPGTLLRVGGDAAARPARLTGGRPPFSVANGGVLGLQVGGNPASITFRGAPAEVVATTALPDNVDLAEDNTQLEVTIDGLAQRIELPADAMARSDFILALNRRIRNGYFRLTDASDGGDANRLVVGSDRRGRLASVSVAANAELGFAEAASASGADNPTNNVGDLAHVTADEIDALLVDGGHPIRAALNADGLLVMTTTATGSASSLQVVAATPGSVHQELGLAEDAAATGEDGAEVQYYVKVQNDWLNAAGDHLSLAGIDPLGAPAGGAHFLTLSIQASDADGNALNYEDLGFERSHPRWVGHVLAAAPGRLAEALENMYAIEIGDGVSGLELRGGLFPTGDTRVITLAGGSDGAEPNAGAYSEALERFNQLEDISIVAAPGSSAYQDARGIQLALIGHAERVGAYRIAVLDPPEGQNLGAVRSVRSAIDSNYAALYYPWVIVSNPLARPGREDQPREITLPPSGFVAGIYARNDISRGVHKAPANEVVRSALRFEREINFAEQGDLNPRGINCLRFLPGRGYRVWGARTVSSDPEWKYVNVRRYFNYIERSIDQGTQWAVFEPNGERLWANVRDTVSAFLYNEWVNGALLGSNQREAFFVRCDRSTMTQNDLDNGRLICEVGIAVLKPAEFVIFRIGQKTADARV